MAASHDDGIWREAIDWLMREHDEGFDAQARDAFRAWISTSPEHRRTYEEATRFWSMMGLIPPADERD